MGGGVKEIKKIYANVLQTLHILRWWQNILQQHVVFFNFKCSHRHQRGQKFTKRLLCFENSAWHPFYLMMLNFSVCFSFSTSAPRITSTLSLQSQRITKVFRQKINIPLWMPKMVFLSSLILVFHPRKWEGNRDPLNERKQSTVSMAKSLFRSSLRQVDSSSHFFMVEFFQAIFLKGARKKGNLL